MCAWAWWPEVSGWAAVGGLVMDMIGAGLLTYGAWSKVALNDVAVGGAAEGDDTVKRRKRWLKTGLVIIIVGFALQIPANAPFC